MITLCFIAHSRQQNLKRIFDEIYKIDEKFKKNLSIHVLNDFFNQQGLILDIENKCRNSGLQFKNILLQNNSYFDKSVYMSSLDTEYIIKCDEDIFLTTDAWNKFFGNLVNIDWNQTGCYVPLITSGIPNVEDFINYFMDKETQKYFREEFSKVKIPNLWGADYSTLEYDNLNYEGFFGKVRGISHYYKGIHPLRVSLYLQNFLVDFLINNENWKKVNIENNLVDFNPVYFCNSVFLMPTSDYKDVIQGIIKGEYVADGFDEVGLNQHIKKINKKFTMNINSVAAHPSYNTIGESYKILSDKFYENI